MPTMRRRTEIWEYCWICTWAIRPRRCRRWNATRRSLPRTSRSARGLPSCAHVPVSRRRWHRTRQAHPMQARPTRRAPADPEGAPQTQPPPAPATPKGGKASDRIELDTTQISGNRELPKVMYVVPWRKADPGEFTGKPLNSLLDEALTPVDRDVFRRQNRYYAALSAAPGSDKSQPGAAGDGAAAPTPKDEK